MDKNWSIEETKKLFSLAKTASDEGKGLVWAFNQVSSSCGKSVNSVRNYYYSQLKMFELVPHLSKELGITLISSKRSDFELFSASEVNNLVKTILIAKAGGKSVRAVIAEISRGDSKQALRLQNKYRSIITHHRDKVNAVMKELGASGIEYFNPYSRQVVAESDTQDNYKKLTEYITSLDEGEVDSFFTLLKKLFA